MASVLPPGKTLFTVPIEACDSHPGGAVVVTEPAPQVYLLAIGSPPDNRQTTALCRAVLRALDLVEFAGLPPGCVVTTSAIAKFYSNGLDLDHAVGYFPTSTLSYGVIRTGLLCDIFMNTYVCIHIYKRDVLKLRPALSFPPHVSSDEILQ